MVDFKTLSKILRVKDWVKSLFVLIGAFYGGVLLSSPDVLWVVIAFCFLSSAVYIYNDIVDLEFDLKHPIKRLRPIAMGVVSIPHAFLLFIVLIVTSLFIAYTVSMDCLLLLGGYLFINLLYNAGLKHIPLLDVLCIAFGFFLRMLSGTWGIHIAISNWLLLSATAICLMAAIAKRRLEKSLTLSAHVREVLNWYTLEWLDEAMIATGLVSFVAYLVYVYTEQWGNVYFLMTVPFAGLGLLRLLSLITQEASQDDPFRSIYSDGTINLINLIFWALSILGLGYVSF